MAGLPVTLAFAVSTHESGRIQSVFGLRLYANDAPVLPVFAQVEDSIAEEKNILQYITAIIAGNAQRVSGWNSRKYATNAIARRCIATGTPFPWYYQDRFGPRYRFADDRHLDLRDVLTDYGTVTTDMVRISDAFSLLGMQVPSSDVGIVEAVRQGILGALLTARVDVVSGRLTPENHNYVVNQIRARLRSTKEFLEGNTDAFGLQYTLPCYEQVTGLYDGIATAIENDPSRGHI